MIGKATAKKKTQETFQDQIKKLESVCDFLRTTKQGCSQETAKEIEYLADKIKGYAYHINLFQ
jgi:hypothetical protein